MIRRKDNCILIVTSASGGMEYFSRHIPPDVETEFAKSASAARRKLAEKEYDVVVINFPLSDELGDELSEEICEKTSSGVVALIKSEVFSELSQRLTEYGVFCVSKPTSSYVFEQAVMLAKASGKRIKFFAKKSDTLREKMEEVKLVSRAKLALMEIEGMTEEEAHKKIERDAMKNCVKKRVIAEEIIEKYKK